MSEKKKPVQKETAKVAVISGKARRQARHLKRHPNDLQSKSGGGSTKSKPKQKLGWTYAAFKNVDSVTRASIRGREASVIYANVLKVAKKVSNLLRY